MGAKWTKFRTRRAKESFKPCKEALGTIEKDGYNLLLTRGQFSFVDIIRQILDQIGPSHISIWTWALGEYDVGFIRRLADDRRILSGVVIADNVMSYDQGISSAPMKVWIDRFGEGSVKWAMNHSKMCRIWNNDYKILITGSGNLNYNPRIEQFTITEGGPDFDMIEQAEIDIPQLPKRHSRADVMKATGLLEAFEFEGLKEIAGIKEWGNDHWFSGRDLKGAVQQIKDNPEKLESPIKKPKINVLSKWGKKC